MWRTALSLSCLAACGGAGGGDPDQALFFEREFTGIRAAPGTESTGRCASWRLGNEAPLYINQVEMNAGSGWHHSNWFFVPEGTFAQDDGVWDCAGEFDALRAALSGGVLFAQSTQATDEIQAFQPGAALEVPAHSVVVGELHVINVTEKELETSLRLALTALPEEEVVTRLHPLAFDFHQLAIPPRQRSRFETSCDMEEGYGGPIDLAIHYVLPHYHRFGTGMDIEMTGGARDGETIYGIESGIGEPLGRSMSPPLPLTGARGIRFACEFDNPTAETITFGNHRDAEMCIMLAFTDSNVVWGGGVLEGEPRLREVRADGMAVYDGDCSVVALLR
ncbi:MAG TPA: hypothetical protein VFU21_03705 [Kofleriaceae bacterium]|nr:hypothetical protein [Kofleriaceae bacterium]